MNNKKVRILPARIYFFGLEEISYQSYGNSLFNDVQYVANHQTAISLSIAKLANRHVDDAIFFRNESETFRHNLGQTLNLLYFKTLRDYIQTKTYQVLRFLVILFFFTVSTVKSFNCYQKCKQLNGISKARVFGAIFFVLFGVSPIL